MLNILNTISRYIVAIVFILSGFVKLIDPFGTAYKISDYVETVNIILPLWLAITASIILSLTEFTLGLNLLFKANYKATTKIILAVVAFFFVLTLVIAITNPVQDCGCFGDALVISNWATFFKNVALLFFSCILVRYYDKYKYKFKSSNRNNITLIFIVFGLFLSIYSIRHLPLIDFRPYKVGTHIPEKMKVPEGMPHDEYETTFVYEKDGVHQQFTEENYPWQDTTWRYVSSENVLVKEGYKPPIYDFAIEHPEWGDITEDILQSDNFTFMLVLPSAKEASLKHADKIEIIASLAQNKGYNFMLLTASIGSEIDEFLQHFTVPMQVYNMDEITLKTMVRAYPGLIILKDGVVLEKYNHCDIPQWDEDANIQAEILSNQERQKTRIIILLLSLILGLIAYLFTKSK